MVTGGGTVSAAVPCGGGNGATVPPADTTTRRPSENRRVSFCRNSSCVKVRLHSVCVENANIAKSVIVMFVRESVAL